jgi:hypothetical protein
MPSHTHRPCTATDPQTPGQASMLTVKTPITGGGLTTNHHERLVRTPCPVKATVAIADSPCNHASGRLESQYRLSQAVERSDRTLQMKSILGEEMIMPSHGQATVWGAQVGVERAREGTGWRQQLRQWWVARRDAHRRATLAALSRCWDPKSETVRPRRADAAPEMAAAQGVLSLATILYRAF